jgi:hypothetical protein
MFCGLNGIKSTKLFIEASYLNKTKKHFIPL